MGKFLTDVDLNQNELQHAVIQNLNADPIVSTTGQIYYNSNLNLLRLKTSTVWVSIISGIVTIPTLKQVVDSGNGISNFGGVGNADILSVNFTNNRTLYLNNNAFATIKIVDNLDAAHNLTIDLDTINLNGVSYNWSSIVSPTSSILSALPFTTDHLTATNNQYVIGDVVYYLGDVYRCIANNDSIIPTATSYWTNIGAGFPIVQQPIDWTSTTGNNQILNKPTALPPSGTAGGDLSGTYPDPTVDGLQGRAISNTAPTNGQVLQWTGSAWTPGAIPNGGSGGSGVLYYFNYGTAGTVPITNLPGTPKELGRTALVTDTSITSGTLSTSSYDLITGFVTIPTDPGITTIPAGLWDLNIWAQSNALLANQAIIHIYVYKYDGVTAPGPSNLLAESNDILLYDPTVLIQYIGNITMPQTTLLSTDRIYIEIRGKSTVSSTTIKIYFGGSNPSHVHTTISSVSGSGLVKVINSVFQSPASLLVDADVSATANIAISKLAMSTDRLLGRTTAGSGIVEQISIGTGLSLSAGVLSNSATYVSPLTTKGDIFVRSTVDTRLPIGSNTQILAVDSAEPTGLKWINVPATGVTNVSALTLTSVAATDLSSTVANPTTTPVITLNVPDASATARGVITTGTQTIAGEKTFLNPTLIKSDYNTLILSSSVYSPGSAGNVIFFDTYPVTATYSSINARTNGGGANSNLILQSSGNGNVGIGTIAPTAKLDVGGDVKISDGLEVAGTVTLPSTTSIGDVSNTEIGHLNGVTNPIQPQIDGKQSYAIARIGSVLEFDVPAVYNTYASPSTAAALTDTLGTAKIGVVQKFYSLRATEPTYPSASYVKLGSGTYKASPIVNIIFFEYSASNRIEYWIVN